MTFFLHSLLPMRTHLPLRLDRRIDRTIAIVEEGVVGPILAANNKKLLIDLTSNLYSFYLLRRASPFTCINIKYKTFSLF